MSNSQPPVPPALQRRTLAVLSAAQILVGLGSGSALALGAVVGERLAGTASAAGLPTTLTTLGAAVAGIPLAALAQRRGRRPALGTGALVAALGSLIVLGAVQLGSFAVMLVGMLLLGASTAVALQARFAAVDLSSSARRGRDLSLLVWTTLIGSVVGPALVEPGGVLAERIGLEPLAGPFVIAAVAQLLAAAVLFAALRPDPLLMARAAAGRTDAGRGGTIRGAARELAHRPVALASVVAVVSAHAVMVAVMALTPVHMTHAGLSLGVVGLSISAHVAGMYALAPVFGLLTDRLGALPIIVAGQLVLTASCIVGFVAADSHAALVTALVLLGLGWSMSTVAGAAMLTEHTSDELRADVQGLSDSAMSLAGAVGGLAAGVVVGAFGYATLVLSGAVVALATVGCVVPLVRRGSDADGGRARVA
ncbi:MFS transporter [Rhodococcus rhodnii]|uniref:Major facilitator superfamily (MFS) profile domain-containing protein n=2 Tax=Rhodococcus rhodnii TaxID=38312 RepID=R7WJK5_9NOCA|nr:MFS transporter [Rhodococcus rhodnii]EOM75478.1 hypothetical protein Rrhod_3276 [Rhodococcus rhodnii LMG 5362]TXG90504.1 MFS transporter [Rhodococcus rhodnii]